MIFTHRGALPPVTRRAPSAETAWIRFSDQTRQSELVKICNEETSCSRLFLALAIAKSVLITTARRPGQIRRDEHHAMLVAVTERNRAKDRQLRRALESCAGADDPPCNSSVEGEKRRSVKRLNRWLQSVHPVPSGGVGSVG